MQEAWAWDEAISSDIAYALYERFELMIPSLVGKDFADTSVSYADNFSYTDPVDSSVTHSQGLRLLLQDFQLFHSLFLLKHLSLLLFYLEYSVP